MNGQQIVSFSEIGKIADDKVFMDGRTMADYKSMLVTIADKVITMIPAAVKQAGKDETKNQLEQVFVKAARINWHGSTDYYTVNERGDKAITDIAKWQLNDVVRMLCNLVDQA